MEKISTDNPDRVEGFNRVLEETVEAMENSGIRYAFIGGVASGGLGRPRSTRDIDLFVRPEDAEMALRALAAHGFQTEKTDPVWIFKAYKSGVLVDIIFKSKGDIYLDQEMLNRMITAEFHGRRVKLISPEDLVVIKAVAHSEVTPNHWHDAIALLSHAEIDWEYLLGRARRAARRILSLLIYAQSVDVAVPNHVIRSLFESVFGEGRTREWTRPAASSQKGGARETLNIAQHKRAVQRYELGHLRERIAEDPRTHELNIRVEQEEGKILLGGRVCDTARREAVEAIVRECCAGVEVENRIRVVSAKEPPHTEVIS